MIRTIDGPSTDPISNLIATTIGLTMAPTEINLEGAIMTLMAASFRVRNHLEIRSHGAFVIGDIETGVIRVGDTVSVGHSRTLMITAVEFADHLIARTFDTALRFRDIETRAELIELMPAGCLLEITSPA